MSRSGLQGGQDENQSDEPLPYRSIFGVLEEKGLSWQKVRMRDEDLAQIEEAAKSLEQEPIRLDFLEEALAA